MKKPKIKKVKGKPKSTGTKTATSTRTEVRSPTSTETSTEAYTQGNITVTGGAGRGHTTVHIGSPSEKGNKVENKKPSGKQLLAKALKSK